MRKGNPKDQIFNYKNITNNQKPDTNFFTSSFLFSSKHSSTALTFSRTLNEIKVNSSQLI